MKLLMLIVCFTLSLNTLAEDYATGGGYDPIAAEKAANAEKERLLIEQEKQRKIDQRQAIKNKEKQKKALADKKAEKARKELLPENMAALKDHEVCIKAGKTSNSDSFKNWLDELKRRSIKHDEVSIRHKQIKINGFECDIFAAYGLPQKYNRSVRASGTSVQFVYENQYIYTDNGIITSWQD